MQHLTLTVELQSKYVSPTSRRPNHTPVTMVEDTMTLGERNEQQ
jgi:hypothetical protein